MGKKFCTNCGAELDGYKFCRKCGHKMEQDAPDRPKKNVSKRSDIAGEIFFWVGWALIFAGGVCQMTVCLMKLGGYIDAISLQGKSPLHGLVFALIGMSVLLGASFVFFVRRRNARYTLGIAACVACIVLSLCFIILYNVIKAPDTGSFLRTVLYEISAGFYPIVFAELAMGLISAAAFVLGKKAVIRAAKGGS